MRGIELSDMEVRFWNRTSRRNTVSYRTTLETRGPSV